MALGSAAPAARGGSPAPGRVRTRDQRRHGQPPDGLVGRCRAKLSAPVQCARNSRTNARMACGSCGWHCASTAMPPSSRGSPGLPRRGLRRMSTLLGREEAGEGVNRQARCGSGSATAQLLSRPLWVSASTTARAAEFPSDPEHDGRPGHASSLASPMSARSGRVLRVRCSCTRRTSSSRTPAT